MVRGSIAVGSGELRAPGSAPAPVDLERPPPTPAYITAVGGAGSSGAPALLSGVKIR